jgi:hypothetical protein
MASVKHLSSGRSIRPMPCPTVATCLRRWEGRTVGLDEVLLTLATGCATKDEPWRLADRLVSRVAVLQASGGSVLMSFARRQELAPARPDDQLTARDLRPASARGWRALDQRLAVSISVAEARTRIPAVARLADVLAGAYAVAEAEARSDRKAQLALARLRAFVSQGTLQSTWAPAAMKEVEKERLTRALRLAEAAARLRALRRLVPLLANQRIMAM